MTDKPTIILTGFAGTVGPHICQKFMQEGYNVIGIDSFLLQQDVRNFEFATSDHFSYVEQDVQTIKPLYIIERLSVQRKLHFLNNVTAVLHFASPASPVWYRRRPRYTIDSNTVGTINMMSMAKSFNADRFVFASTSEIYGCLNKEEFKEEDIGMVNSYGNRSCYDTSKMMGETLVKEHGRETYGLSAGMVRIFNTYSEYGPKNDGRVISNFVSKALSGQSVEIFGSGKQTRSFMYASDLAEGVFRYTTSNLEVPINLGNPHEYHSINELARIVNYLVCSSYGATTQMKIKHVPIDKDDPPIRRPNIDKAIYHLGWEPKVTLKEGLLKVCEAYNNNG